MIFGKDVRVKATIYTIDGLSAHADQAVLINWLQHFQKMPKKIFVVHGEFNNSSALVTANKFAPPALHLSPWQDHGELQVQKKLNWSACIPERLQSSHFKPKNCRPR